MAIRLCMERSFVPFLNAILFLLRVTVEGDYFEGFRELWSGNPFVEVASSDNQ